MHCGTPQEVHPQGCILTLAEEPLFVPEMGMDS